MNEKTTLLQELPNPGDIVTLKDGTTLNFKEGHKVLVTFKSEFSSAALDKIPHELYDSFYEVNVYFSGDSTYIENLSLS